MDKRVQVRRRKKVQEHSGFSTLGSVQMWNPYLAALTLEEKNVQEKVSF